MSYRKFPFVISMANFNEDIKPLVKEVRPFWDVENLKTKQMHGGVSNILYGIYHGDAFKEGETDMILVRVYGKVLLDRDLEMVNMSALSKHNLASNVWGQFENGCCYQYIHGSVMDDSAIWKPQICTLIINEFVKLHTVKLDIDRPKTPFLFTKMREMAQYLPPFLNNNKKNSRYLNEFPSKERIFNEISELERELVSLDCPVSFCHNDLLVRNMVLNIDKDRVHMIDFEYADYNYSAFDIGNHFNEFAGLENTDYSLYPNKTFQLQWLRQYLETLYLTNLINEDVINVDTISVDDAEVERWFVMTNKFSLASHLFWCVWCIWQEINSLINFDYLDYGLVRWRQYISCKEDFLAL